VRRTLPAVFLLLVACCVFDASGQSYRSTVNTGNDLYKQKNYTEAKKQYEAAATKRPEKRESHFNAGNTAYRTGDVKAALENYKKAAERSTDKEEAAQSLYNAGNTFMNAAEKGGQMAAGNEDAQSARMEGYRNAIEAYKHSLKLNPDDQDTRYNLAYAMRRMEELRNQQKNNKQNKDQQKQQQQQKQDQKQDQNKDKQDQQQQQKQDQQQQQKQDQQKQQQQQPQQPKDNKQMSKQQAEQILRALERQEKDLQKKLKEKQGVRVQVDKDW
jgi:Ca-activated chloride channel homolog